MNLVHLKLKNISFQTKCLIGCFFLFFLFFSLTPITGDDWGNYLVGKRGLESVWNTAVTMYDTWEGRFVSRIFLDFFTYHKWLWNMINAGMITFFVYCCYKVINCDKKKAFYLLPIIFILVVNRNFFSQCYLWLAGNMTYLFPTVMTIGVFLYCFNYHNKTILSNSLICIISFMIPMFVENIGCAYVGCLVFYLIYEYIKSHKISRFGIVMLILASFSLIMMLLSPGSQIRMEMNQEFYQLSLFERIFHNIPKLIYYMFFTNGIVTLVMLIPINYVIFQKISKKTIKYCSLFLFNIIPILTILQSIILLIPIDLTVFPNFDILSSSDWYVILYYLLFTILFLYTIIYIIKDKDEIIKMEILELVGILSLLVMLVTPTWGDRVSVLYAFSTFTVTINLISKIGINRSKVFSYSIITWLILMVIYYLTLFSMIYLFNIRRENDIKKVKDTKRN